MSFTLELRLAPRVPSDTPALKLVLPVKRATSRMEALTNVILVMRIIPAPTLAMPA